MSEEETKIIKFESKKLGSLAVHISIAVFFTALILGFGEISSIVSGLGVILAVAIFLGSIFVDLNVQDDALYINTKKRILRAFQCFMSLAGMSGVLLMLSEVKTPLLVIFAVAWVWLLFSINAILAKPD